MLWTTPPGSTPPQLVLASSGSRTRDSGAGGGRSNKERQRLQPLASVARASLFEVRGARFYTQPLLAYIHYTDPLKPHSRPGHGTNVTTPPGSTPPQLVLASSGSRTQDSGAGGGSSNKERQRLQPLASLFEVRGARFYTQPLLAYIRYTDPPKPHSRPGHGTNVTTPPGSTPPQLVLASSGSRTQDSGAGGGSSNKERQRIQPLVSVARAPHFEVRRVRFTLSPYWHTSVTYLLWIV